MYEDIDFKKMVEQEPDLKAYFSEVLVKVFLADKNSREMLKAIYNFRNIGMTTEQVADWVIGMQKFNPPEEEE